MLRLLRRILLPVACITSLLTVFAALSFFLKFNQTLTHANNVGELNIWLLAASCAITQAICRGIQFSEQ
jgi:hypothetical protein